jgi:CheY-like chemotaxis protein
VTARLRVLVTGAGRPAAIAAMKSLRAEESVQLIAADLLLTDVVMPEMLGNEVAARVGEIRPGIPALFMSGYAQPILDTHGIPAPRYDILEKPFTEVALLTRVRRAFTRPRQPSD